jgi:hypothetical protein
MHSYKESDSIMKNITKQIVLITLLLGGLQLQATRPLRGRHGGGLTWRMFNKKNHTTKKEIKQQIREQIKEFSDDEIREQLYLLLNKQSQQTKSCDSQQPTLSQN